MNVCRSQAPKYAGYTGDCTGASWTKHGYVAVAFEGTLEKPYSTAQWGSDWSWGRGVKYWARKDCQYRAGEPCKVAYMAKAPYFLKNSATGGYW